MNTQLSFHETQFNVVNHNNQTWLTSKELAQALAYSNDRAVTMIFNKHADEFSECMTKVLEMSTSGNIRACCRVFSLRGAHLIAMFALTPVAKEFRRWVLDVLDRQIGDHVVQPAPPSPTYPPFSDDYANRTELIYYRDFKPSLCRVLTSEEIVATPESLMKWMRSRGLMIFTREDLKAMTHAEWLMHIG